MTPRQIAEAMADATVEQILRSIPRADFKRILADALQVVAEEETKRERAACVKIATDAENHVHPLEIADRIRARGAS